MSVFYWIIIGLVAGWLATQILGGRGGLLYNLAVGLVGAIVGGAAWSYIQNRTLDFNAMLTGIDLPSIIAAVVGAVVLGALGGWWGKRRAV